ncbi:hypothetical protein T08_15281 [Trichinella sp. T8]|nr:hypothetical protein T08_15281 [Trichinella sp. T8]
MSNNHYRTPPPIFMKDLISSVRVRCTRDTKVHDDPAQRTKML